MRFSYKLSEPQLEFVNSEARFTIFNAGRSSGKTFAASLIAARALLSQKKVIVFAQNFKALSENLMVAIDERLSEMTGHLGKIYKFNPNSQKITYGKGAIYGMSYENIETCRGFTDIEVAIYDEIAIAPANLLSTVAYCLRGKNIKPRQYAMTTPRFGTWWNKYLKDNQNDKTIKIIHATVFDLNKKDNDDESVITQEQIDNMIKSTLDENMLRQELYGELIEDNSAGVLFSSRLLSSTPKFLRRNNDGYAIGIDCSGLGKDSNVIVVRNQNEILDIVEKKIASNSELCSIVRGIIMTHGKGNLSHIAIDEAYGLDLHERLSDAGITAIIVPFGGKAKNPAYANQRAEMYINLKKGIEEYGLKGINDELYRELQATKYILNNNGKIQLIPKDEIKLNIGRSPDIADALALTYTQDIIPLGLIEADREIQNRYML